MQAAGESIYGRGNLVALTDEEEIEEGAEAEEADAHLRDDMGAHDGPSEDLEDDDSDVEVQIPQAQSEILGTRSHAGGFMQGWNREELQKALKMEQEIRRNKDEAEPTLEHLDNELSEPELQSVQSEPKLPEQSQPEQYEWPEQEDSKQLPEPKEPDLKKPVHGAEQESDIEEGQLAEEAKQEKGKSEKVTSPARGRSRSRSSSSSRSRSRSRSLSQVLNRTSRSRSRSPKTSQSHDENGGKQKKKKKVKNQVNKEADKKPKVRHARDIAGI